MRQTKLYLELTRISKNFDDKTLLYHPQLQFLPNRKPHPDLNTNKPRYLPRILPKMTNACANNCLYYVYLIQSRTRKQWCEVTIDSLKTLLAINTITNGMQLSGWGAFDEKLANERILLATACAKKATRDMAEIENILRNGCNWCIPRKWKNRKEICHDYVFCTKLVSYSTQAHP